MGARCGVGAGCGIGAGCGGINIHNCTAAIEMQIFY